VQVIIPMSGEGSRFRAAGYNTIKPLITVDSKPMIEHVVSMFPGDHEFIFICREDHAKVYMLKKYLRALVKNAQIVTIAPHKLGPVYAVVQADKFIRRAEPIILSYCDYYMKWDFNDFISQKQKDQSDGDVICYTGFHPHLLHPNNFYAGCRINAHNQLLEIKEKYSFESDKMKGYHSVGAYYFKTGGIMLDYFTKSLKANLSVNGEFYVSMVYNLLREDNLNVTVYDKVLHFCQWGTPVDLSEYCNWLEVFKKFNYK